MRTIVQMANRSDRREDTPRTPLDTKVRPDEWHLARVFHFGQERKGSRSANLLHSQAGDTDVGLTHRLQRRAHHQLWFSVIGGRVNVDHLCGTVAPVRLHLRKRKAWGYKARTQLKRTPRRHAHSTHIRGPTGKPLDKQEESRYGVPPRLPA